MPYGHSMLSTFGWWVAWVYLLSLAFPWMVPPLREPVAPPPRPAISFGAAGFKVSEGRQHTASDPATELVVRLSEPAPADLDVKLFVENGSAEKGRDFHVRDSGRSVHFAAGSDTATIRFGCEGPDIGIVDDAAVTGDRTFVLRLGDHIALAPVDDAGRCPVTICEDDSEQRRPGQVSVRFAVPTAECSELTLAEAPIHVRADSAIAEAATLTFSLSAVADGVRRQIGTFTRSIPAGSTDCEFKLSDVLSAEELRKSGLSDDDLPGGDFICELDMLAKPPLFPDMPRRFAITVADDDAFGRESLAFRDAQGRPTDHLPTDPPGSVTVAVDRQAELDIAYRLEIDGKEVLDDRGRPIVMRIPSGRTSSDPLRIPDSVAAACRGRRCGVACRPCEAGGSGGGGLGTGAGGGTGGPAGPGGSGRVDGSSSAGQGGGGCRGQKGCGATTLFGEPVPGDCLLVLVNNARLHEPGDEIVKQVQKVLAGRSRSFQGGVAVVVNRDGESTLAASGPKPTADRVFRPLEEDAESLTAQLGRISKAIAARREVAAREDVRAIVVWPDRELGIAPLPTADTNGLGPVSFLCPATDPLAARAARAALIPKDGQAGSVTFRAPRENEIVPHLENVLDWAASGRDEPPRREPRGS